MTRTASLLKCVAAVGLAISLAGPALAAAPPPRKAVEVPRFLGRWFEVARTPNPRERPCVSASMDFATAPTGRYAVVQTCRKATGVQTVRAGAQFVDPVGHAKLDLTFFGGLIRAHYWVLDHDPDYRWAVIGTSGGHYVWLLARSPSLPPSVMRSAEASLRSLGYDPAALVFPKG